MIVPVVLCGGSGTRLWPLSRKHFPKQFHSLHNDKTLLQDTAIRARSASGQDTLLVVTNDAQHFLVSEQLAEFPALKLLIEPVSRNTAPAIGLAAIQAVKDHDDAMLLVMPSDHLISDTAAFTSVVDTAHHWARQGRMVTFGIKPASPETGYGYIQQGRAMDTEHNAFEVKCFVEKPDLATASGFVEQGTYFWNSGIFMFSAAGYLDELQRFSPEVYAGCSQAMAASVTAANVITASDEAFSTCPDISVDYAVMEKTDKAVVVPYNHGWSDIGSWGGLADALNGGGEAETVTVGQVYTRDVKNSYIHATGRLVAAVGVEDSIIVETDDAVLVTNRQSDQQLKQLVDQLRQDNRCEVDHHTRVYRPWGSYQSLQLGDGFQVKRLIIKPGASISLQLHHHRSEHWVVVKGEARVRRGEEAFTLSPNESTFIPRETLHKLANPGPDDLEIIEVQTGDYLGEDDIVRFEDQYGRV